jgi:uncharacterized NAD-dependent epimerase/dehydratase family protein
MQIKTPYLLFIGEADSTESAKMAIGIAHWRPENVVGKISFPNCKAKFDIPELGLRQAASLGAKTLVLGVVNSGGFIPNTWINTLLEAMELGMDIASGMHTRLNSIPVLVEKATQLGRQLIDVREPQPDIPIGKGLKRKGLRLLTVGTDCSVGKMFTALAIEKEMRKRNLKADFRATGQTGIMIAGSGVPIDAVVSDFVAGAAEIISPDADSDHWDIVEGQGSLFHASFAGVTIGLLHGSQPDAIVICHDPSREMMRGLTTYALPDLRTCMETNLQLGRLTNPNIQCVGFSLNTSRLSDSETEKIKKSIESEFGLPCVDSVKDGVSKLVDQVLKMNF